MVKIYEDLLNKEFWYDDIVLSPYLFPDFERDEVDLTARFTKRTILKTPFVSSPMDTVTGAEMAILMARLGGIGVLHYNYPTIEEQIKEVEKVKKWEAAFIKKPVCLSPEHKVKDVFDDYKKFGFYSHPITEDGTLNTPLAGIVTHRNVRYLEDTDIKLKDIMTPKDKLITAHKKDTLDKNDIKAVNQIIRKANLDTLLIVDDDFKVVALVSDRDLQKDRDNPIATKDDNKQLKVFAAVESRLELAEKRIPLLYDAGASGIVIDAGIVFKSQFEIAKYTKENFPGLEVVVGNVCSAKMVKNIIKEAGKYTDAIRVGVGPGQACITRQELGAGRAQGAAIYDCAKAIEESGADMPLIADGGIKRPADIVKALGLGASTVMMGQLLAGLEESPGEPEYDPEQDRLVKKYRGMGSLEAMEGRAGVRYGIEKQTLKIAEGIVKKVSYKGSGYKFLFNLAAGVKQSFQKNGFKNIKELQEKADIRLAKIL